MRLIASKLIYPLQWFACFNGVLVCSKMTWVLVQGVQALLGGMKKNKNQTSGFMKVEWKNMVL
jgi:hypothetical protein